MAGSTESNAVRSNAPLLAHSDGSTGGSAERLSDLPHLHPLCDEHYGKERCSYPRDDCPEDCRASHPAIISAESGIASHFQGFRDLVDDADKANDLEHVIPPIFFSRWKASRAFGRPPLS